MDTTELIKFITALPAPAAIAFAAVLAMVVGVSWRGILQGRNADPAKDAPVAQAAAVIVDPTALNNATAALKAHTAVGERTVEVLAKICVAIDGVSEQLEDLAREMIIQREINRRN